MSAESKSLQTFLNESFQKKANPKRAEHDISYIKSDLPSYGCPVPYVRTLAKKIQKELPQSLDKQRLLMQKIWKESDSLEMSFIPLFYFSDPKKVLTQDDWDLLQTWIDRIDNWAQADYYAQIITRLHSKFPEHILPVLIAWNTDNNPWKRRLSLTGLIYYARTKENPPPLHSILCLLKARLHDTDHYVQKAVGWTLREAYEFYPTDIERFLFLHAKDLSSYAFSAATERWDKEKKASLRSQRAS